MLAQSCCKNRAVNTWAWKEPLCIYPNMCARKINTQSLESSARKRFGLASGQWSASLPYPSPFRPCPLDVVQLSITSPLWPEHYQRGILLTNMTKFTFTFCPFNPDAQWRQVKQMQPVWLCIFSGRQFEDTYEETQWRKAKQLQPVWLCILPGK